MQSLRLPQPIAKSQPCRRSSSRAGDQKSVFGRDSSSPPDLVAIWNNKILETANTNALVPRICILTDCSNRVADERCVAMRT